MEERKKHFILTVLALIIAVGVILFPFHFNYAVNAQEGEEATIPGEDVANLIPGPFGGKIQSVERCSCIGRDGQEGIPLPYGKLIEVGPPREGKFLVLDGVSSFLGFGTRVYDYEKIEKDHWVLGNSALPPLPCNRIDWVTTVVKAILSGDPVPICREKDKAPRVTIIGTGAIPAGSGFSDFLGN